MTETLLHPLSTEEEMVDIPLNSSSESVEPSIEHKEMEINKETLPTTGESKKVSDHFRDLLHPFTQNFPTYLLFF
jgi:hypothetical protein